MFLKCLPSGLGPPAPCQGVLWEKMPLASELRTCAFICHQSPLLWSLRFMTCFSLCLESWVGLELQEAQFIPSCTDGETEARSAAVAVLAPCTPCSASQTGPFALFSKSEVFDLFTPADQPLKTTALSHTHLLPCPASDLGQDLHPAVCTLPVIPWREVMRQAVVAQAQGQ